MKPAAIVIAAITTIVAATHLGRVALEMLERLAHG